VQAVFFLTGPALLSLWASSKFLLHAGTDLPVKLQIVHQALCLFDGRNGSFLIMAELMSWIFKIPIFGI